MKLESKDLQRILEIEAMSAEESANYHGSDSKVEDRDTESPPTFPR